MRDDESCCRYGQLHRDNASSVSYFGETSNHPGDSMTSGFSKLTSPSNGKRFQAIDEIQKNMTMPMMTTPTKDFPEKLRELREVPRHHCPTHNIY